MPPSSNPAAYQPWFQGAPWTKLLGILWVVAHLGTHGRKNPSILQFASTGELVVGLSFLTQHLRRLEREMGSRQFVTWLLWVSCVVVLALRTVILFSFASGESQEGSVSVDIPAPLPYALIGGVVYWYFAYVPRLHPRFLSVGGLSLSEKVLHYAWAAYLVGALGYSSLQVSAAGFVASWLYFLFRMPCLPNAIVSLLPWQSLGNLFFLDPPPKVYAPMLVQQQQQQHIRGINNAANLRPVTRATPRAPVAPPQAAIDQLTAMGFDEVRVRQALEQTNNNVERAADRLLSG